MRMMTSFICQQCGYRSPKFLGRCPNCMSWNSLVETAEKERGKGKGLRVKRSSEGEVRVQRLSEVKGDREKRMVTGFSELDRVLGGGIVSGSVTLLSGDPGIGKSTLLLALSLRIRAPVLYVCGEESPEQIKMRALRLQSGQGSETLYVLPQNLVEDVIAKIEALRPHLIIIDSIQTMESETLTGGAGSIGQIRECAGQLIALSKKEGIPIFLVGHVTKEGLIAGPMVLSHMVDALLFLEGERFKKLRVLRALKNRFGPVDEVGVFELTQTGIHEVKNPSELFLSDNRGVAGSVVVASVEGTRPMLTQIQALVVPSKLQVARRIVSGVDAKRVELLSAVLQKQCHLPLDRFDIFVNATGGITLREPGIDLGICLSIFSNLKNKTFRGTVAIGEVGLLGELRKVADLDKRMKEAKRLGFTTIITAEKFPHINDVLKHYG